MKLFPAGLADSYYCCMDRNRCCLYTGSLVKRQSKHDSMLLLHISDIHFRAPDCLNPDLDPERPYRTKLLQDVRIRIAKLGPVDAILISGDIAFKGSPQEYSVALEWLKELATVSGCSLEKIFSVPGNHDVDRSVAAREATVRNVQAAIARAQSARRERELRFQFGDPDAGRAMLAPLAAYNEFAKIFNCQIYPPDRLYWKADLALEEGVRLRLFGLTSTILSGMDGQDDTRESLYLSPLQTVLDPVDDVVNLVLCHHPPDWLMDQDDVNDAIRDRAAVHLFGHKHRQRIEKDDTYIRFSAGAVNPERNEPGWQPGYNLIDIHVVGTGRDRVLKIEAHLLQWQSNPDRFRPMLTAADDEIFRHSIPIPGHALSMRVAPPVPVDLPAPDAELAVVGDTDVEATMSTENTRHLVFRFWQLTASQRREIACGLGLITEDEMSLPEPERYGRALRRAGERGLLDQLVHEISQREAR